MSDDNVIEEIGEMTITELLKYVLVFPEYLTDGYYSKFRKAILKRGQELGVY